jgi:hypothetical protein
MGTPDKDYGEIVVAIIVPCKEQIAGSASVHEPVLTLKALQRWAHNLLAPYKVNCSTLYFLVLEFFHSFSIGKLYIFRSVSLFFRFIMAQTFLNWN